jgi:hypothetical protein
MSQELGDEPYGFGLVETVESDGTNLNAGDAVSIGGSNQASPTTDGDDLYGVVVGVASDAVDLSDLSAGDLLSVKTFGDVNAAVGSSVTQGDLVETSSTSGQLAQNTPGTEIDLTADDSGTTLALNTAKALSDAGGTAPTGESLGSNEASIFLL